MFLLQYYARSELLVFAWADLEMFENTRLFLSVKREIPNISLTLYIIFD
jgi:hypothetical protein